MSKPRTRVLYKDPHREGMVMEKIDDGDQAGCISWPAHAQPSINKRHIDGQLCVFRNGELHWLTLWERYLLRYGRTDAYKLERKYRPHLQMVPKDYPRPNPETPPPPLDLEQGR